MNNTVTAEMAHDRADAIHQSEKEKWLGVVYDLIAGAARDGQYTIECEVPNIEIGNYVFDKLVDSDYYVEMEAEQSTINNHNTMRLAIGWEDAPRADDKKYILPLEETEHSDMFGNTRRLYALKLDSGAWTVCFGEHMHNLVERGAYVTAKELEEAPEWVKAIEPVEVKK